jgi:hypothetical protein
MGSHNIKTKMAAKVNPEAHIADPAACANGTAAVVGDLGATQNTGWGASSEANFDKIHTAIDALVADIAAHKTAIDANNTAIDSILTTLETWGITASS